VAPTDTTRNATISDVARHAGVSLKTASRVLNNAPYPISDSTKRKVDIAVEALGYHPNLFARALVRRQSHLIGLVYDNPSPSFVVELQRGVLHRLASTPYRLLVMPFRSSTQSAAVISDFLRSAAIDGVVLAPPASENQRLLEEIAGAGIACARISSTGPRDTGSCTMMDDYRAASKVAWHLIELGHRDVAIIRGDPTHSACEVRMQGYRDAFESVGVEILAHRVADGFFTLEGGRLAGDTLLRGTVLPTAILAQNDDMAVGALAAARALGVSVPTDLSIVGFDDSEIATAAWPTITTVRQPIFEMAATAACMVVSLLDGSDSYLSMEHRHSLIVRGSSGIVRRSE